MSKVDAERALAIYKIFSRQTDEVVAFLGIARTYENATRLEIPKLKHAPTSLTSSLEEYLNDADFEINRRQYLAQQEAKKSGKSKTSTTNASEGLSKLNLESSSSSSKPFPEAKPVQASATKSEPKGPAPDLIDFFESIEQNQQPMNAQPQTQIPNLQAIPQYQFQQQPFQTMSMPTQQQPNGAVDSMNPFASMVNQRQQNPQQSFTGLIPQEQTQAFSANQQVPDRPQDQSVFFSQQSFLNGPPRSQSTFTASQPQQAFFQTQQQQPQQMPNNAQQQQFNSGQPIQSLTSTPQQHSTNPFRQSMMPRSGQSSSPFSTTSSLASPQDGVRQSTNPFARSIGSQPSGQTQSSPFTSPPPSSTASIFSPQSKQSTPAIQSIQPARTGTNPFARSAPSSTFQTPTTSPLVAQTTGTNPFRQSAFVNQQTGHGWQAGQGTMGGLEKLDTIPVFPRPVGQPQPQSQQPWQ